MTGIRADTSMGLSIVRILALGLGGLMILTGLAIVVATPLGVVRRDCPRWFRVGIVVVAVLVERMRYRSEAAERGRSGPGAREAASPRPQMDPRFRRDRANNSSIPRRVTRCGSSSTPKTGERRYRAED